MIIKTRLAFKEYLNLMYILTYRKPMVVIVTIVSFISMIVSALIQCGIIEKPVMSDPYTINIFALVFLVLIPLSVYRSTKKNFDSNKNIREAITYNFSGQSLIITGETFNSDVDLNSSYKIEELKKWFLIYTSNRIANLIPKAGMTNKEIIELRAIFRNLDGIKVKIKNL